MGLGDPGLMTGKRTKAELWRPEAAPENTAPPTAGPGPSLDDWGVTQAEARDMLTRQMCPVCGEGPWKSPLNHASKKHGIDRFTMRDLCGLILKDSVTDPELAERFRERGATKDMSQIGTVGAGSRRKYRHTSAGLDRLVKNLDEFNARPEAADISRANARLSKTPEAIAKRSATFRKKARP